MEIILIKSRKGRNVGKETGKSEKLAKKISSFQKTVYCVFLL